MAWLTLQINRKKVQYLVLFVSPNPSLALKLIALGRSMFRREHPFAFQTGVVLKIISDLTPPQACQRPRHWTLTRHINLSGR